MCGIVAYVGDKDIESILMVGLERLSYRGYDSSGIATMFKGEMSYWKAQGKLRSLQSILKPLNIKGELGIGHTRWATHGEPTKVNAHPHVSLSKKIALVHNGIIENFNSLKYELHNEGHIFRSQTDTEVLIHLIEKYLESDLLTAVNKAITHIQGTYAFAVISELEPNKIIFAKKGSPLILGIGDKEHFLSSDINSIVSHTKNVIYLEDNEIGYISSNSYQLFTSDLKPINRPVKSISWSPEDSDKSGFDHYMLKEIFQQPAVVRNIISKMLNGAEINFKRISLNNEDLASVTRFIVQACGTSWHAGLIQKFLLEKYTRTLTEVDISSELRYRHLISKGKEIVIALSQSGETADTLACILEAKSKFFKILSFVNVKNSSIDRESDGVIYSHAGPEIGVASTKNYISQLVTSYLFTLYLAKIKWTLNSTGVKEMLDNLKLIPDYIDRILESSSKIKQLADKYYKSKEFIFIGRGINYPTALEGALKLKEISYIHAIGYPAGELKHGPIALIDHDSPVVCIAPHSATYDKMLSNIMEVKARKGRTIVVASEGDNTIQEFAEDIIYIPKCPEELSPILAVIPLQLFAYYTAINLGCNVDQPRNLAKSVTVE